MECPVVVATPSECRSACPRKACGLGQNEVPYAGQASVGDYNQSWYQLVGFATEIVYYSLGICTGLTVEIIWAHYSETYLLWRFSLEGWFAH